MTVVAIEKVEIFLTLFATCRVYILGDIVGQSVNSHGYQALSKGYDNVKKFMHANDAKSRVMSAMRDTNAEFQRVGMLNSQAKQFSSAHSVSVDLNSVSKEVITEMARLPAQVNIEIADEIRASIRAGDWPKNKTESSRAILAVINDYINFVRR